MPKQFLTAPIPRRWITIIKRFHHPRRSKNINVGNLHSHVRVLMRKPTSSPPLHVSSHVETCLIHHLCWAVVAGTWLMSSADPLTVVPNRILNPLDFLMVAGSNERSPERVPRRVEDLTQPAVQTRLPNGVGKIGSRTEILAVDSNDARRVNIDEAIEFINQMDRNPLSATEKIDLAEILNLWQPPAKYSPHVSTIQRLLQHARDCPGCE